MLPSTAGADCVILTRPPPREETGEALAGAVVHRDRPARRPRALLRGGRLRRGLPLGSRLRPRPDRVALSLLERSEEHTSELQSLRHLVCRLLLEKKKTRNTQHDRTP